jgi:hypothetical protein
VGVLAGLGGGEHEQAETAVELGGRDGREREIPADPRLARARVRERDERHAAIPAQEVVGVQRAGRGHRRLGAHESVPDGDADVEGPSRRIERDAPFGARDPARVPSSEATNSPTTARGSVIGPA